MTIFEKIKRVQQLRKELIDLECEILVVQGKCDHEYIRTGFDENLVYFECSLCGHTEKRNHTVTNVTERVLNEVEKKFRNESNVLR